MQELGKLHELIASDARAGLDMRFHTHALLPHKVFVQHGDDCEVMDAPPAHRAIHLDGVASLADALVGSKALAGRARPDDAEQVLVLDPEIYVSQAKVHAWLDRRTRRESVQVELPWTEAAMELGRLSGPDGLAVRPLDVRRTLRKMFGRRCEDAVLALSSLSFRNTTEESSSSKHGQDDLGARVERAVVGADGVPERFEITTPLWSIDSPGQGFAPLITVSVYVHLDTEKKCAVLDVNVDELSDAVRGAVEELCETLRELTNSSVPVYQGSPS